MSNTTSFGKRALTIAVVAMTILWTAAAGLLPLATSAQSVAGDLVRSTSFSAVFYVASDGMRYVFPNANTYNSWYTDFSEVTMISDSALAAIPLGGNITYRPGSRWMKITSDERVYAPTPEGTLRWVEDEATATALYGAGWSSFIDDMPDEFFSDYTVGVALNETNRANGFEGMLYSANGNTYLVWDGERHMVTSAGMAANRFQSAHVLNPSVDLSALPEGDAITGLDAALADTAEMGGASVPTGPVGSVSVSLASDTPAGVSLPRGANGVEMTKWAVRANGGDVTVNNLALTMGGIGATTNVSNVYLYEGSTRLTEARSVNSTTRKATFSSLGWEIPAGQTKYLSVVVETSTSASAADTASFRINAAGDLGAGSSTVSGSFPLTGNTFTFSAQSAGTITITKNGTITSPTLGQQDATIGQFQLAASSEDANFMSVRLNIDDAADHSNFKLWQGSTQLATGVWEGGDTVRFALNEAYVITDGNSRVFKVSANIGGDASDAVKVHLDNSTDLVVVGGDFGFNMAVTNSSYGGSSCTSTSGSCSYSTIQGGEITFVFNGPSTDDIATDSTGQVLMNFSVTAENEVTVKDLDIIIAADDDDNDALDGDEGGAGTADDDGLINTTPEANVTNIRIVDADTGETVMGPLELDTTTDDGSDEVSLTGSAEDAAQIIDFTDDWTLEAGETRNLQVVVDIDDTVTSGTEFAAILDRSGLVIDDENGDAISLSDGSIVPSGDINGNNMQALSPSVTFALASSPVSNTVVQGTQNVDFLGTAVTAGDGSDVTITSMTYSAFGDDTSATSTDFTLGGEADAQVEDFLSSCSLYDGDGNLVAGPEGSQSSGNNFVFDDMNWTLEGGSTALLMINCNLSNPSDSTSRYFAMNLGDDTATSATNVVSQDEDGDDIAETGDEINGNIPTAAPTVVITIADNGTMTTVTDGDTPDSGFILTGTSNNPVTKVRWAATNEAFLVTDVRFQEEAAEDMGFGSNATTYANNISRVHVSYLNQSGQTETKSAVMTGNAVTFSGMNFYVPSNQSRTLTASVDVPNIDRVASGSATSGERIQLDMDVTTTTDFRMVGQGSGDVLTGSDITTALGNQHVVRETKPTISISSQSPSGASVPGLGEVLRFNVAAHSNEDVLIYEIVFDAITTDNNGASSSATDWNECGSGISGNTVVADFSLYETSDLGNAIESSDSDWTLLGVVGDDLDACSTTADLTLDFVQLELSASDAIRVAAGTTKSLSLYFDSTGASAVNDDAVRFDILEDPITTNWDDDSVSVINDAALAATDSVVIIDQSGSSNPVTSGDIVCTETTVSNTCVSPEEIAFVTGVSSSSSATTNMYLQRGYLASTPPDLPVDTREYLVLPSSFVWGDDGDSTHPAAATELEDEMWGSLYVEGLPLTGHSILF